MSLGKVLTLKGEKIRQRSSPQSPSSDSEGDVILSSVCSQSLRFLVTHQHPMDAYLSHKKKRRILKKKLKKVALPKTSVGH